MLYYYLFVALTLAGAYVWATKKYGRPAAITSWRNAINQNWALYRRRLLKRTRSQTPPALFAASSANASAADQVPLIISDHLLLESGPENVDVDLRSVTSDGASDLPASSDGLTTTTVAGGVRTCLIHGLTPVSCDAYGIS